VAFTTTNGLTLRGWYHPSANGAAVVLTHGYGGSRDFLMPQAETLVQAGFGVLTFDLRGHGESDGDRIYRGWREVHDVIAAAEWVQSQPDVQAGRVGAYGFSIGAQATLRAAARSATIRAVVADGPVAGSFVDEPTPVDLAGWANYPAQWVYYAVFPLIAGEAEPSPLTQEVTRIAPRPALLIAAGTGHELRQERKIAAAAGDSMELYEIPEAVHGGGIRSRPSEFRSRIKTFYLGALASP
jgi:pimeloyl-ACP methyl ester carboxylesterase